MDRFINTHEEKNEQGLFVVPADEFAEQTGYLEELVNIVKHNAQIPKEKFDSLMAWVCTMNNWLSFFLRIERIPNVVSATEKLKRCVNYLHQY